MKNLPALPSWEAVDRIIVAALLEDIGPADITTQLTIDPSLTGEAGLVAREAGRICGLAVAQRVFASVEPRIRWEAVVGDGDEVVAGTILSLVRGPVAGMLSAERVALNLLQRMSGIATQTARYVQAVAGTGAR
ncbi:MAG TPA: nicotinate-nucleotide diphosphorylase (carboxylating), partial [Chloroflexota bacterium]|nr:nicotinate-nucleotide diphosphorylase (carboxylating) [Chloroflexota bacterium]